MHKQKNHQDGTGPASTAMKMVYGRMTKEHVSVDVNPIMPYSHTNKWNGPSQMIITVFETLFRSMTVAYLLTATDCTQDQGIESLIDDLRNISEPGMNYSYVLQGDVFSPFDYAANYLTSTAENSNPKEIRVLVEKGAIAIPALIKHLDDTRAVALQPISRSDLVRYVDTYDFNPNNPGTGTMKIREPKYTSSHLFDVQVTVGDICFSILGQILNRRFSSISWMPQSVIELGSPRYSKQLMEDLVSEWGSVTTPEAHRIKLENDFKNPDRPDRNYGAYLRLAFYYPDVMVRLVNSELDALDHEFKNGDFSNIDLIQTYRYDSNPQISDRIKDFLSRFGDKEQLVLNCAHTLAARGGHGELLVATYNRSMMDNPVSFKTISLVTALANNKPPEPLVEQLLLSIVKKPSNETCFVSAIKGISRNYDSELQSECFRQIESQGFVGNIGEELLRFMIKRFPEDALQTFDKYLASRNVDRVETACSLLSRWGEKSNFASRQEVVRKLIVPYLGDKRLTSDKRRVRDSVALAIHVEFGLDFDPDGKTKDRNAKILKMQKHFANE